MTHSLLFLSSTLVRLNVYLTATRRHHDVHAPRMNRGSFWLDSDLYISADETTRTIIGVNAWIQGRIHEDERKPRSRHATDIWDWNLDTYSGTQKHKTRQNKTEKLCNLLIHMVTDDVKIYWIAGDNW